MATSRKKKRRKRSSRRREPRASFTWAWVLLVGGSLVAVVFIVLAVRYASGAGGGTYYPPTDITGHTETSPPAHILDRPLSLGTFKHMLEHADGSGPPGVIISYNCEDYACAPDLIDRLRAIAEEYPDVVYLAPFPDMTAKIAVTRRGKQIVLEEFDEQRIREFIEGG